MRNRRTPPARHVSIESDVALVFRRDALMKFLASRGKYLGTLPADGRERGELRDIRAELKRRGIADPPAEPVGIRKGEKGGVCNRTACDHPDSQWFNNATSAYYCGRCARAINEYNPGCCILPGGGEPQPVAEETKPRAAALRAIAAFTVAMA